MLSASAWPRVDGNRKATERGPGDSLAGVAVLAVVLVLLTRWTSGLVRPNNAGVAWR